MYWHEAIHQTIVARAQTFYDILSIMWPKTGLLIPFQIGITNLIDIFLKTWDVSTLSITYKCVHINTNIK